MNELDQYLKIINNLLIESSVKINKWSENFMREVLLLYLIIPGQVNFLQLVRYEINNRYPIRVCNIYLSGFISLLSE